MKRFNVSYEVILLNECEIDRAIYDEKLLIEFLEELKNNEYDNPYTRIDVVIDTFIVISDVISAIVPSVQINLMKIKEGKLFSLYVTYPIFKALFNINVFNTNNETSIDLEIMRHLRIQDEYIRYENANLHLGSFYGYLTLNTDYDTKSIINEIKLIETTEI